MKYIILRCLQLLYSIIQLFFFQIILSKSEKIIKRKNQLIVLIF
jgi:hypothetical protein